MQRSQWCMPLIPTLVRQRQTDFCAFEASLSELQDSQDYKKRTLSGQENGEVLGSRIWVAAVANSKLP